MELLNYESKHKFYLSLSLVLIFLSLVLFIAPMWILDLQRESVIEKQLKMIEIGAEKDAEFVGNLNKVIDQKDRDYLFFKRISLISSAFFLLSGFTFFIIGLIKWKE